MTENDISDLMEASVSLARAADILAPLLESCGVDRIEDAAQQVGASSSGSWIGYHANVYYADYQRPPPGAHFSSEWGFKGRFQGTTGDWRELDPDVVERHVYELAGSQEVGPLEDAIASCVPELDELRDTVLSVISTVLERKPDSFLHRLREKAEVKKSRTTGEVLAAISPGQVSSRDSTAMHQGLRAPPHIRVLARCQALRSTESACRDLSAIAKKAASHLSRVNRRSMVDERIGQNVFIGHGQSPLWRELKDFVESRLALPWDEFNRVPVAGVTNVARLAEMLDAAAIALLVMTAEDQQADGAVRARANVVHEAGLFQGRLGFSKAVILLESGCEEFSNITGLGQIRFPKGNIKAVFEDVRSLLEREGLLDADGADHV